MDGSFLVAAAWLGDLQTIDRSVAMRHAPMPPGAVSDWLFLLPTDVLLDIFSHLPLRERLMIRVSSKAGCAFTSLPEHWADLAVTAWANAQGASRDWPSGDDGVVMGEPTMAGCVKGATLVDACARMVAWPTHMLPRCLVAIVPRPTGDFRALLIAATVTADTMSVEAAMDLNAVHVAAVLNAAAAVQDPIAAATITAGLMAGAGLSAATNDSTSRVANAAAAAVLLDAESSGGLTVSMRLPQGRSGGLFTTQLLGVALANAAFPHMQADSVTGMRGRVGSSSESVSGGLSQAPLPFATPAGGLGAPGHWALRLTAYCEFQLLTPPPKRGALYVGLVDGNVVGRETREPRRRSPLQTPTPTGAEPSLFSLSPARG